LKCEAMLHETQRIAHERLLSVLRYDWIWYPGVGSRVAGASLGKMALVHDMGPCGDMCLKG